MNYYNNAKIVKHNELPKIGEQHNTIKNITCIELRIVKFTDKLIIYEATFCENTSLDLLDEFFMNCCYWLYAIER